MPRYWKGSPPKELPKRLRSSPPWARGCATRKGCCWRPTKENNARSGCCRERSRWHCGSETLNPFDMFAELTEGKIAPQTWREKCREWGIEGALLVVGAGEQQAER